VVGVRVRNTGATGSIVGSLRASDTRTGMVYELPLRDSGPSRASQGSYPWRLDGDYQTRVMITNVGTTPAMVTARIHYGSSDYVFPSVEIKVGAARVFDLRQLRDAQVPDSFGNRLPRDLEQGQFYWSIRDGRPGAAFSGRSQISSVTQRVSSSYSCQVCCPDSSIDAYILYATDTLGISSYEDVFPQESMQDCYGNTHTNTATVASWGYDANVLSVTTNWDVVPPDYGFGGVAEGSTWVTAYWSAQLWYDPSGGSDPYAVCI